MKRDEELVNDNLVKIDEYTEAQGYSVFASADDYFKAWEQQNQADQNQGATMQAEILSAKVCINGNLALFVKPALGQPYSVFIQPAKAKALGLPLDIEIITAKSPKGIEYIKGAELIDDPEVLKAKLKGKLVLINGKDIIDTL